MKGDENFLLSDSCTFVSFPVLLRGVETTTTMSPDEGSSNHDFLLFLLYWECL